MVTMLAAAPDSEPAAPAGPQWVVLLCDDVRLAVPLAQVREILTPRPFTRLPGCGPEVCGLIGVRGRVVTVFDLGIVLGRTRSAEVPDHRLLLLEWRGRAVGLAVDAVLRIAPAETVPDGSHDLPLHEDDVIGIGAMEHERFVALDPDHLLDRLLPRMAAS
jgi:purine-binding chemotaxis protein CheW